MIVHVFMIALQLSIVNIKFEKGKKGPGPFLPFYNQVFWFYIVENMSVPTCLIQVKASTTLLLSVNCSLNFS